MRSKSLCNHVTRLDVSQGFFRELVKFATAPDIPLQFGDPTRQNRTHETTVTKSSNNSFRSSLRIIAVLVKILRPSSSPSTSQR